MDRLEYLNTIGSQKSQYDKRFINNNFLKCNSEPFSKKAFKRRTSLAKDFRKSIKEQLTKNNRRCHKSGINLEIVFEPNKDNPPTLQTLVKSYLDLLHKELPDIDNLKSILFKDDNQIKYLNAIINYNLFDKDKPHIRIRSYRHSYFIKDLEFAYRIINKKFTDSNALNYYDFEEEIKEDLSSPQISSLWDSYYKYKNKESYTNFLGEDGFYSMSLLNLQDIQQAYLKLNKLSIRDLLIIFNPLMFKSDPFFHNDQINKIHEATSKMIMFSFKLIPLVKYPKSEGDSIKIKNSLTRKLAEFKDKHEILFPLVQPVRIIILYSQPENVKREIDPDNLARKHIVPLIQNIFKPPTIVKGWESFLKSSIPKYSILGYEVVQIPRDRNTPKEGQVSFIITDGHDQSSLWRSVNDLISKFMDKY